MTLTRAFSHGVNRALGSRGGLTTSPGSKSGLELNAPVTSRKWRPSPKPASDAPVSVIDCIYRFDGEGAFTSDGGTWGDARYIELYMLADDDEYLKAKTGICFINLVEYDFVVTTRAANVSPNALTFTSVTNANLSTAYTSNSQTIAGLEAEGSFTVAGGTAELNNSGTFTASGAIVNTDTIKLLGTSEATYLTPKVVTFTAGNTVATYTITTKEANVTPEAFSFTDATGVELSTVTESDAITVSGIDIAVPFTVTGGEAEVNDSGVWATIGTVEASDTVKSRARSSDSYATAVNVILNINGVSDTFTITTKADPGSSSGFPFTLPFNLG